MRRNIRKVSGEDFPRFIHPGLKVLFKLRPNGRFIDFRQIALNFQQERGKGEVFDEVHPRFRGVQVDCVPVHDICEVKLNYFPRYFAISVKVHSPSPSRCVRGMLPLV